MSCSVGCHARDQTAARLLAPEEKAFAQEPVVRRALDVIRRCARQDRVAFAQARSWQRWILYLEEEEHVLQPLRRDLHCAILIQSAWRSSALGKRAASELTQRKALLLLQALCRGWLTRVRYAEAVADAWVMAHAQLQSLAATQAQEHLH